MSLGGSFKGKCIHYDHVKEASGWGSTSTMVSSYLKQTKVNNTFMLF